MCARCYPFKMSKRRFHGMNPQVYIVVCTIEYRYVKVFTSTHQYIYQYILVYTGMYQYEPVYTDICTYKFVLLCTSTYAYIQIHTSTYWYIPVCSGMYWYKLLVFTLFSGAEGLGCVLLATQPPQSHTSLASTGIRSSPWDVQTLQLQMAGVAAMCMRSTRDCGTLAMASHAWVV